MGYFDEVYEVVKKIPKGKVATYGQIAKMTGYPHRAKVVGWALHCNPYYGTVPCHRVVDRNGRLSKNFAFGGADSQRRMLEAEGIIFNEKGIIELSSCLWKPE